MDFWSVQRQRARELGLRLNYARAAASMSLDQLSNHINRACDAPELSRIERGIQLPDAQGGVWLSEFITMFTPTEAVALMPPFAGTPARSSDPTTSHEAAASVKNTDTKLHRWLFKQIAVNASTGRDWGCTHHGLRAVFNASIPQHGLRSSESGLRTRVAELKHVGFIEDSGRRLTKDDTGRKAVIWQPTHLGLEAMT
jgi:hypothetical protein